MIFQHAWEQIIYGTKTQDRRLVLPGERLIPRYMGKRNPVEAYVIQVSQGYPNGRIKWQVGKTYSVQPGRGKPALMVHDSCARKPSGFSPGRNGANTSIKNLPT